jgi:4-hydroxy-tetrahydrodipicolinate reductase
MGQEILNAIEGDLHIAAIGVVDAPGKRNIGTLLHSLTVTDNLRKAAADADIMIDFSGASGTVGHIKDYEALKLPVVIGSTGLSKEELSRLAKLSKKIPLLVDSNMSVGVNIMLKLVEFASRAVGPSFDTEILEAHHRYKKDAPSGTALALAKAASGEETWRIGDRSGERVGGTLGIQALRGGDTAGEHTVYYFGEGERLEITHRATSRAIFARGALRAAKWLYGKPAGYYRMKDVLEL